jgi:hypothetical protein
MMRAPKRVLKVLNGCDPSSYYESYIHVYGHVDEDSIRLHLLDALELRCSAVGNAILYLTAGPSAEGSVTTIHEP